MVVTGLGLCCPLGDTLADALTNLKAGAILADSALDSLPDNRSARAQGPDLRPWLKRRKDGKLLAEQKGVRDPHIPRGPDGAF